VAGVPDVAGPHALLGNARKARATNINTPSSDVHGAAPNDQLQRALRPSHPTRKLGEEEECSGRPQWSS
jgi:hypothetical protein